MSALVVFERAGTRVEYHEDLVLVSWWLIITSPAETWGSHWRIANKINVLGGENCGMNVEYSSISGYHAYRPVRWTGSSWAGRAAMLDTVNLLKEEG